MTKTNKTRSGGRRTAFEFVREELRHKILTGELEGGTHLTQVDIAREMGVSTTPVREAFRELASEGLFSLDVQRGAIVRQPNLEDAEEIFMMRRMLEPQASRLAANWITDEELHAVRKSHNGMVGAVGMSDWFSYNREFHRDILSAARSPRLVSVLHSLFDATAVYIGLSLRSVDTPFGIGQADHVAILAALEQRDGEALAARVIEHLDHVEHRVRAVLD